MFEAPACSHALPTLPHSPWLRLRGRLLPLLRQRRKPAGEWKCPVLPPLQPRMLLCSSSCLHTCTNTWQISAVSIAVPAQNTPYRGIAQLRGFHQVRRVRATAATVMVVSRAVAAREQATSPRALRFTRHSFYQYHTDSQVTAQLFSK